MRQSKFTETQIVSILKEADAGRPVNEIWRTYSISSATDYKWKAKYGGWRRRTSNGSRSWSTRTAS
jgi:putative transposase